MQQTGSSEGKNRTKQSPAGTADPPVHPVLYVDDDCALLEVCKLYFDQRGSVAITCAASAKIAIELLKTRSFEVIISDYQMPGMNGIDLLVHLRLRGDPTPFILFTGKSREEIVIEAINNGATYYLQKHGSPKVLFAELEHKILEAIRRQTAEKSLKESEARYRAVFENSMTAMIIHEEDLTISQCNDTFLQMTRWERGEVEKRKNLADFIPQETIPQIGFHHRNAGQQEETGTNRYHAEIFTRNGESLLVHISAERIPGTTQCIVSLFDITGQKRLEEELKRREEEIRLLYTYLAAANLPYLNPVLKVPEKAAAGGFGETIYPSFSNPAPVRMWDLTPSPRNRKNDHPDS